MESILNTVSAYDASAALKLEEAIEAIIRISLSVIPVQNRPFILARVMENLKHKPQCDNDNINNFD